MLIPTLTPQDLAKLRASGAIRTERKTRQEHGAHFGKIGGPARAASLSPARRLEIARLASAAAKAKRDAQKTPAG